jgi:hypothetical protein
LYIVDAAAIIERLSTFLHKPPLRNWVVFPLPAAENNCPDAPSTQMPRSDVRPAHLAFPCVSTSPVNFRL